MSQKKILRKLVKQIYPSSAYSLRERKKHRKYLYDEMISYWQEHPEESIEDICQRFCEENPVPSPVNQDFFHNYKRIIIVSILIIGICLVLYLWANLWVPPTYYIYYK